jgi:tetratricopeptide (TPR) repeat protein
MRSGKVIIVCVFFALLVSLPTLAQHRFTLRGAIRTPANANPSLNTRIQLQGFGVPIYEMFVHESSFELRNVEEGHYTLVADDPDYETVLQEIDVPSGGVMIDFRPRRNAVRRAEAVTVWDLKVPEPARRQFEAAKKKILEYRCSDALALLKKAIHRYAEYGDAHEAMGECYVRMDQLESAEQEFKRALEQPHKPELHLLLGTVHTRQGKQALVARQLQLFAEEKSKVQGNQK